MTTGRSPLGTLRRITASRPTASVDERCDMCSTPVPGEHQHVVDLTSRSLMCTCRPCYLLFTDQQAELRYRAVPARYLSFPGFLLGQSDWDDLQIPVGLAFLFRNTRPGPGRGVLPGSRRSHRVRAVAGRLGPGAGRQPGSGHGAPGRGGAAGPRRRSRRRSDAGQAGFTCHVVPIDACYELVGRMRRTWRGFDGGQEARAALDDFFAMVDARSRPRQAPHAG